MTIQIEKWNTNDTINTTAISFSSEFVAMFLEEQEWMRCGNYLMKYQ